MHRNRKYMNYENIKHGCSLWPGRRVPPALHCCAVVWTLLSYWPPCFLQLTEPPLPPPQGSLLQVGTGRTLTSSEVYIGGHLPSWGLSAPPASIMEGSAHGPLCFLSNEDVVYGLDKQLHRSRWKHRGTWNEIVRVDLGQEKRPWNILPQLLSCCLKSDCRM